MATIYVNYPHTVCAYMLQQLTVAGKDHRSYSTALPDENRQFGVGLLQINIVSFNKFPIIYVRILALITVNILAYTILKIVKGLSIHTFTVGDNMGKRCAHRLVNKPSG